MWKLDADGYNVWERPCDTTEDLIFALFHKPKLDEMAKEVMKTIRQEQFPPKPKKTVIDHRTKFGNIWRKLREENKL